MCVFHKLSSIQIGLKIPVIISMTKIRNYGSLLQFVVTALTLRWQTRTIVLSRGTCSIEISTKIFLSEGKRWSIFTQLHLVRCVKAQTFKLLSKHELHSF